MIFSSNNRFLYLFYFKKRNFWADLEFEPADVVLNKLLTFEEIPPQEHASINPSDMPENHPNHLQKRGRRKIDSIFKEYSIFDYIFTFRMLVEGMQLGIGQANALTRFW